MTLKLTHYQENHSLKEPTMVTEAGAGGSVILPGISAAWPKLCPGAANRVYNDCPRFSSITYDASAFLARPRDAES